MNASDVVALALLAVTVGITAGAFQTLPEKVPVHWNAEGRIDGWADKSFLWITPILSAGMLGLFRIVPKIAVKKEAFEKSKKYYNVMVLAVLGFLLLLQAGLLATAANPETDIGIVLYPGVAFMFLAMGWSTAKFEPNYFVGFRTPWALADKRVWKKTQAYGGKTMMLLSIMVLANVFVNNFFLFFLAPLVLWAFSVFVYSYTVYKRLRR